MKTLRIGITLGLFSAGESLWTNGIKQNAIYLCEALSHCPNVDSVLLVNMTSVDVNTVTWDRRRWPVVDFAEAKDRVDVLIELGGQISADQTAYLKGRGAHLVSYCCGVEYVNVMQSIIFGRKLWGDGLFINPRYDAVWVIPQVADTSEHFFRTFRRCETSIVPFVWDPVFLTQNSKAFAYGGAYQPRHARPARLTVCEPNIDVVKFCLYPILIAEEVFRRRPEAIEILRVTNGLNIARSSPEFISLMNQLDIVRGHKAVFTDRHDTPQLLAEMTDVVISNQWGNPLNYHYLEVCWQGYPLVHNAALCADLGYFYTGNDVQAGSRALEKVLTEHDAQWEDYKTRQRAAIARFLPGNARLTARYASLLTQLIETAPR